MHVRNTPEPPFFIVFNDDAEPEALRQGHPPEVRPWHVVTEARCLDWKGTMEFKFLGCPDVFRVLMTDYMIAPPILQPDSVSREQAYTLIDNHDLIHSEYLPVCADWLPTSRRF